MSKTKIFLTGFLAVVISIMSQSAANAFWFKKKIVKSASPVFAPVNDVNGNKIWIGTFQLVWNDLMNDIVKAPVQLKGGNPELADKLNKQGFDTTMLNVDSYYKAPGIMTPKFKQEIEKGIWHKFGEKSDILDGMNWNSRGYLVYAMLIKNFEYLTEFDILDPSTFVDKKVKFFGIGTGGNKKELYKNADVLFYNSKDEYAVKLKTKDREEVILYRTDDVLTLEEYFNKLNKNEKSFKGNKKLVEGDFLKVPFIKFNKMFSYDELTNKKIKGTDFTIDGAIQTAKFSLDNKGGKLKSEAALIMRMSLAPIKQGRNFYFDKPFVLFLKEEGKQTPYFVMYVKNGELLEEMY